MGNGNANVVDCVSYRNKFEGLANKSLNGGAPYNRSSFFNDSSIFKISPNQGNGLSSTPNQKQPLNNRRLLSTSSTDQAFGSSKSLSNTEVTSQTSALSSASCSSSSSLMSSSFGVTTGKDLSNISTSKDQSGPYKSLSIYNDADPDHMKQSQIINDFSTKPPPIPPKTSSNNHILNPPDDLSLPPALPATDPPTQGVKSEDHRSMILNSIRDEVLEGKELSSGKDDHSANVNELTTKENIDPTLKQEPSGEPMSINEQVIVNPDIINAVIYIDDEDDLGAKDSVNIDTS